MKLKKTILEAIESVNKELKIDELNHVTDDAPLFELLDSLGTLDLILELEASLEELTGRYIAVANELSMDAEKTPFLTIVTLQRYLEERITDESN